MIELADKIFPRGHSGDTQVFAGFYTTLDCPAGTESAVMELTARSFYKLYINGEFVSYGPARAAHEHARADTLDILPYLAVGRNHIAVEVIGYSKMNLEITSEAAFLAAAAALDGRCVLRTGPAWKCFLLTKKIPSDTEYAAQRFFVENYTLSPGCDDWRVGRNFPPEAETEVLALPVSYQPRTAAEPDFAVQTDAEVYCSDGIIRGSFGTSLVVTEAAGESSIDFRFREDCSGFPGIVIEVSCPAAVTLEFPEKLTRETGEVITDGGCMSTHYRPVIHLDLLEAGEYSFEAFEPTLIRYLRVTVGGCRRYTIRRVYARRCQMAVRQGGGFRCSDAELTGIAAACRTSAVINVFDVMMDCAGRERGAWNDVAYWGYPAWQLMTGDLSAEKCYLENYLCAPLEKYYTLCPCCYPAKEGFPCLIHNWTIYLLLGMADYVRRSGDCALLLSHRDKVVWIVGTLRRYENRFGLLEKLDELVYMGNTCSRGFSERNAVYNQPISAATNAMYAAALEGVGAVLGEREWLENAARIRAVLARFADAVPDLYEGGCFPSDGFAMDEDGRILPNGPYTEGSQYFLMLCGVMDRTKHPHHYERVLRHLGPCPADTYSHDGFAVQRLNFEGDFFARCEVLYRNGEYDRLITEIRSVASYMMHAFEGLMGEGWDWLATTHHSFNVYFGGLLERTILGVDFPDEERKTLRIAPYTAGLRWARGQVPVLTGVCAVRWTDDRDAFRIHVSVPDGYTVLFRIPDHAAGHDRRFLMNGRETAWPEDGILTAAKTFDFTAEKKN